MEEIAGQADLKVYTPGDAIIRQGDIATEFFILIRGEVEVVRANKDGKDEHLAILGKRGDYFGEIGLLQENSLRSATVRATGSENAEVLAIRRDTFLKMVDASKMTLAVIRDEMIQRLDQL